MTSLQEALLGTRSGGTQEDVRQDGVPVPRQESPLQVSSRRHPQLGSDSPGVAAPVCTRDTPSHPLVDAYSLAQSPTSYTTFSAVHLFTDNNIRTRVFSLKRLSLHGFT